MDALTKLDLVPTDDLLAEIAKRYDWMIFMARTIKGGPHNWEVKRRYKGDIYCCLGIASDMEFFLNSEIAHNEEISDGKGT